MALKSKRPAGVTVIAILVIIGGVLSIVVAMLLPTWPAGVNLELRDELTRNLYANAPPLLQVALAAMSGVFFALGIVSMMTAWGLLNARKWSWTVALILALISVVRTIVAFVFSPAANTVT